MKNNLEFNKDDFFLKNVLTYGIAFLTMFFCLRVYLSEPLNSYIKDNITKSNLIPYGVLIITFIFVVILCNFVLSKVKIVQYINKCNLIYAKIICIILVLICAYMLFYVYLREVKTFDAPSGAELQYHSNEFVTILFIISIFFAVVYFIESYKDTMFLGKVNKKLFYLFAITVAIVYAYSFYTPNCFSNFSSIHHGDAYFTSVYRAMMGVPRSDLNTGIYGCYGILLAPFVKLLGGTLTSFFIVISILGGFSLLCMAYAIDEMTKSPVIKVFGVIALTVSLMSMQWSVYLQLYPHRTLFPSIMVAYMVYIYKRNRTSIFWSIGGYILAAFSIVWSTEIGIICLITWVAFELYDKIVKYSIIQISLYKYIVINIIFAALTFSSALIFVNVINILMGGETISLENFLFPLLTTSYMSGFLTTPLPESLSTWVIIVGLFLVFLAHCITKTKLSPIRLPYSLKDKVLFGISILGIGQITYYINRTAWGNLRIVHYITILIICILSDMSIQNYINKTETHTKIVTNIYRSIAYITTTVLVAIAFGGISTFYSLELHKTQSEYRNTAQIENLVYTLEESIPKDTKAVGNGIVELYSYLDWNPYYYIIDFSDIEILPEAIEYMNNELSQLETPILIEYNALKLLERHSDDANVEFYENNVLTKSFTLYDMEYCYYEPKNN